MSGAERAFTFVQFEFPWALGPPDGRYVLRPERDAGPASVLVLKTLGAPERRTLRRRRARDVGPEPAPAPVSTARATIIDAGDRGLDQAAAEHWLREAGEPVVSTALAKLNEALAAHRLAAADPYVREVAREAALATRVGYGAGDEVADGRWTHARELPAPRQPRQRRTAALRPQERFAALLGAREAPLACEELTLRARLDLDSGRLRECALQLRVALETAVAELDLPERVQELGDLRKGVETVAAQALAGKTPAAEPLSTPLARLEAALRARAAREA